MKKRTSVTLLEDTFRYAKDLQNYFEKQVPGLNFSMIVDAAVYNYWRHIFHPEQNDS